MLDRTGGTGTGHVAIGATVDFRWGGVACNAFGRQAEWYCAYHGEDMQRHLSSQLMSSGPKKSQ